MQSNNTEKDVLKENSFPQEEVLDNSSLEDNLLEKEKELSEKINYLESQLKLSLADFSNYKKRIIKEQENISFIDNSKIILEFLSFKELLEKAISHEENEVSKNNLLELNNNFENILQRLNIKKINLEQTEYDYHTAECVQTSQTKDKEKENKVLEVLENAYTFKEKLIKPGKVIVGKYMEE